MHVMSTKFVFGKIRRGRTYEGDSVGVGASLDAIQALVEIVASLLTRTNLRRKGEVLKRRSDIQLNTFADELNG